MKLVKDIYYSYFQTEKKSLLIILLLCTIGFISNNIIPIIYGIIIDYIFDNKMKNFCVVLGIYGGILLLSNMIKRYQVFKGQKLIYKVTNRIREKLYSKIVCSKCEELDKYTMGEIFNIIDSDSEEIVNYFLVLLTNSLSIVITMIISAFYALKISWQLTLISVIILPMTYLVNMFFEKKIQLIRKKVKKSRDKYFDILEENVQNIQTIKVYGKEEHTIKKFKAVLENIYIVNKENVKVTHIVNMLQQIIENVHEIILLFIAAVLVMNNKLTVGTLIAFNTYIARVCTCVSDVVELHLEYNNVLISMERTNQILKIKQEILEGTIHLNAIRTLEVKNIYAGYGDIEVLKNISLKIMHPGLYSIIGENGAGKSTFLKVLIGLYEYNKGEILVNGIHIDKVSLSNLRDEIFYVEKNVPVFAGNIIENINIVNETCSEKSICEICEKVGLQERDLKKILKEKGCDLSSGQKQRMNIARMLSRKSSVILLDEITSDIDSYEKRRIIEIIKDISKTKIILNVTHDKEFIEISDEVITFSNGKRLD